jgi:hypothetical protein
MKNQHEKLGDYWTYDENEEFDDAPDALDRYVEELAGEIEAAVNCPLCGDSMGVRYITREMLDSWEPCGDYTSERIDELAAGRSRIAVTAVFDLPIPAADKVWLLCHEGILPDEAFRGLARKFALHVIDRWDAPAVVRQYLETGNEEIRAAARNAAWAAAWDAARDAARAAAEAAAWAAAEAAAWDAAMDAARAAAWDAAEAVAADGAESEWQLEEIRKELERCWTPIERNQ